MTYRTPDLAAECERLRGELAPLTYADALAACVGRWGEPADLRAIGTLTLAVWDVGGGVAWLESGINGILLLASAHARGARWMLHDALPSDTSAAPVPLADALDAAAAWLAARRADACGAPGCGGGAG